MWGQMKTTMDYFFDQVWSSKCCIKQGDELRAIIKTNDLLLAIMPIESHFMESHLGFTNST
jgi:hypothetical protein